MSNITLSAGIRANLLSLQNTANLMQTTQNDLATGKKVNSALDNPLNFFTSQSLNTRADALSGLLDAMSNGIQTIQAANNGITSITSLVQQLQSVASQARSDTTQVAVTPGVRLSPTGEIPQHFGQPRADQIHRSPPSPAAMFGGRQHFFDDPSGLERPPGAEL